MQIHDDDLSYKLYKKLWCVFPSFPYASVVLYDVVVVMFLSALGLLHGNWETVVADVM